MKANIIAVHAWMDSSRLQPHIAYQVMKVVCKHLEELGYAAKACVDSTSVTVDDVRNATLLVFATGTPTEHVQQLMLSAKHLVAVFEDVNWATTFKPGRSYDILTWALALNEFASSTDRFSQLISLSQKRFDIDKPRAVCTFPLAALVPHDKEFRLFYNPTDAVSTAPSNDICYVGSLKADRRNQLLHLAKAGCDFYGNFTREQLLLTLDTSEDKVASSTAAKGRLEPAHVVQVMRLYKKVAFIPDEHFALADMDALRYAEMALAGKQIVCYVAGLSDLAVATIENRLRGMTSTAITYDDRAHQLIVSPNYASFAYSCLNEHRLNQFDAELSKLIDER